MSDNKTYTDDFSWSSDTDTIVLDNITLNAAGAATDYYITDTNSIGTITLGSSTVNSGMWTNGTTSSTISFAPTPSESSIQVGEDVAISAPSDGPAVLRYKDQEIEIGQLFSMFNAFKSLLKGVANDTEFCERHPEIRDMAYGYLIEELKK